MSEDKSIVKPVAAPPLTPLQLKSTLAPTRAQTRKCFERTHPSSFLINCRRLYRSQIKYVFCDQIQTESYPGLGCKPTKESRAFTFIELLVVIAIIAILGAFLSPNLTIVGFTFIELFVVIATIAGFGEASRACAYKRQESEARYECTKQCSGPVSIAR